jgi:hypothetical protein
MKKQSAPPLLTKPHVIAGLALTGLLLGVLFTSMFIQQMQAQLDTTTQQSSPTATSTATPTATPSPSPSPSPTPTPTPKPSAKPATESKPAQSTASCDQLRSAPASDITVRLQPRSGSMVGRTVIRIKPSGSCPGSTDAEQWINEGELSKSFSNVGAGTYVIEVANGNYQGVVRQNIKVEGSTRYEFTVKVND